MCYGVDPMATDAVRCRPPRSRGLLHAALSSRVDGWIAGIRPGRGETGWRGQVVVAVGVRVRTWSKIAAVCSGGCAATQIRDIATAYGSAWAWLVKYRALSICSR